MATTTHPLSFEATLGWMDAAVCEIFDDEPERASTPSAPPPAPKPRPLVLAPEDEYSDADADGDYDTDDSDGRCFPMSSPQTSRFAW